MKWSKKRIFALLTLMVGIAALLMNPSKEEHHRVVQEKTVSLFKKELNYSAADAIDLAMQLFGHQVVNEFIENHVIVENYYFFSLTKIRWEGKDTLIGGGAFSQVWLSKEIDKQASTITQVLKNL